MALAYDIEVLVVVTVKIHVFWDLFISLNGRGTGSTNCQDNYTISLKLRCIRNISKWAL